MSLGNPLLTIIIPCYNEEDTISDVLKKVATELLYIPHEVIVVDDGSQDTSRDIINECIRESENIKLIAHEKNLGKTASINSALKNAKGDIVVIQDADLEYNPSDILKLYLHMVDTAHPIVYGSRNLGSYNYIYSTYFYGGIILTKLYNFIYADRITDLTTCYKMFKREILKKIEIKESGFAFCAEVTCKAKALGYKIVELPIDYKPRKLSEGKKIRYTDGIHFIWVILKNSPLLRIFF